MTKKILIIVGLQNQKLDQLLSDQSRLIEKYEGVQVRLGTNERAISVLQIMK